MEQESQNLIQPEQQPIDWDIFWQKAEAALGELKAVKNFDESHIIFVERMDQALTMKDANVFASLVVNEWERFRGALHAQYYDLPNVDDFIIYVGELVKHESTD